MDTRAAVPLARPGAPDTEPEGARARDPGAGTGARLERLRRVLEQRGLAGALILCPPNVRYLAPHLAFTDRRALVVTADVVALEAGVYTGAIGARVEELYVVREDGPELISHASRGLRVGGGTGD